MIRISTCSYRRVRHVLLVDVHDYAFLGWLRLARCGRNRDSACDCKNNDKQTDFHADFHVSSPKNTEAIELPRAPQTKFFAVVGLFYLAMRAASGDRHADNIRLACPSRVFDSRSDRT